MKNVPHVRSFRIIMPKPGCLDYVDLMLNQFRYTIYQVDINAEDQIVII